MINTLITENALTTDLERQMSVTSPALEEIQVHRTHLRASKERIYQQKNDTVWLVAIDEIY
jgi:hypothetical protein